jgi:predicted GIY-YIG superfamily endonuclease
MQFVYLLKCADNTTYTGCTQNIEERLKRYEKKQVLYTSSRLPVKLINYIAFTDKYQAFKFEKYLNLDMEKHFQIMRFCK